MWKTREMVRTTTKMFLKKRIFLTSLTTTLHFSRAHHWLLHSFPPFSTCSSHLYFSRPSYLLCIFPPSGLVMPPLARVSRLFVWLNFSSPHHWLFHNFSSAALPLSLLFYFPALVIWSVRSYFLISFFPALQYWIGCYAVDVKARTLLRNSWWHNLGGVILFSGIRVLFYSSHCLLVKTCSSSRVQGVKGLSQKWMNCTKRWLGIVKMMNAFNFFSLCIS